MSLRYDQVAELIKIIDASACDELVLETPELKLSLRRHGAGAPAGPAARGAEFDRLSPAPVPATASPAAAPAQTRQAVGGLQVRSPMVGTFFRASSPDAPPFVEVGSRVSQGQPLCMIEVMKLFTTLYADTAGKIVQIAASNGELVEYDTVLFVIETDDV